jgi:hypothetical protein
MDTSNHSLAAHSPAARGTYTLKGVNFGKLSTMLSRCLVLLMAVGLEAAIITPDTATASSQFNANFAAVNTINGSGLTAPITPSSVHANYANGNHWTTDGSNPTDEFIDWGFNTPQTIGTIYIWNHRSNSIAANSGYEPTLFDLILFDASNTVLLTLNNVALLPDVATAQTISFALTNNVSRVRFDVEQTQSSTNYTGLAEVRFDTTSVASQVPEPATVSLIAAGLGLACVARRRASR